MVLECFLKPPSEYFCTRRFKHSDIQIESVHTSVVVPIRHTAWRPPYMKVYSFASAICRGTQHVVDSSEKSLDMFTGDNS
ncbi:hypothetical protein TNIN_478671 [Trichonephila inaurata madagascariensis]|uniref:Uncharacterized protein n=1 Tax=Trichonephila inaurata madagascariensis TaxID=2747483 RepID=A0A8X6YNT1_9ARAC|nr:hypothetical protein TNIN_478671 [Trichonephila inaurata madagascariensis]